MTDPAPADQVPAQPVIPTAPAGWYPVGGASTQLRYWDGSAWTPHFHDPAAAAATSALPRSAVLRAPEGTSPNTVWAWLTAVSPVVAVASLIPTATFLSSLTALSLDDSSGLGRAESSPAYLVSALLGFLELVLYILFPILDWRALAKRGVPQPFHWAWSLAAIILSTPAVYMIGRTVVVKRRTGKGLAPLWVFIVVQLIAWAVGIVVIAIFVTQLIGQLAALTGS